MRRDAPDLIFCVGILVAIILSAIDYRGAFVMITCTRVVIAVVIATLVVWLLSEPFTGAYTDSDYPISRSGVIVGGSQTDMSPLRDRTGIFNYLPSWRGIVRASRLLPSASMTDLHKSYRDAAGVVVCDEGNSEHLAMRGVADTCLQGDVYGGNINTGDAVFAMGPGADSLPYDLDPDFTSSREAVGACGSRLSRSGRGSQIRAGTHESRVAQETARALMSGGVKSAACQANCDTGASRVLNFLYSDVMGIANPAPAQDDLEWIGEQGVVYKEPAWTVVK